MIFLPCLGIFQDFFHWLANYLGAFVQAISKFVVGIQALYGFISSGVSLIITISGWLPVLFSTLILLGISALVIKLVVGR